MDDALTYHTRFSPEALDAEYNLRVGRPDYEDTVIPAWIAQSTAARAELGGQTDIPYGPGEKQKLDIFPCAVPGAPTLVYLHGGYWQRGDKSIYSFLARPFVAAGVHVVVVGYDLCPAVTITRICGQIRAALVYLWREADALGITRGRLTVMGHSAGGHLTQMMMATDWPALSPDLPADLIASGLPISPLSYLEPVRLTAALNAGIRMDAAEAHDQSPMTCHPPVTNAPQMVVVGGTETDEFHRQARIYVEKFANPDRAVELYVVPGVDHFDELNVLADPSSPFFAKTVALLDLQP